MDNIEEVLELEEEIIEVGEEPNLSEVDKVEKQTTKTYLQEDVDNITKKVKENAVNLFLRDNDLTVEEIASLKELRENQKTEQEKKDEELEKLRATNQALQKEKESAIITSKLVGVGFTEAQANVFSKSIDFENVDKEISVLVEEFNPGAPKKPKPPKNQTDKPEKNPNEQTKEDLLNDIRKVSR